MSLFYTTLLFSWSFLLPGFSISQLGRCINCIESGKQHFQTHVFRWKQRSVSLMKLLEVQAGEKKEETIMWECAAKCFHLVCVLFADLPFLWVFSSWHSLHRSSGTWDRFHRVPENERAFLLMTHKELPWRQAKHLKPKSIISNLDVFKVKRLLAVLAVERPLRALALVMPLLFIEAYSFFTRRAGDEHELALPLVVQLWKVEQYISICEVQDRNSSTNQDHLTSYSLMLPVQVQLSLIQTADRFSTSRRTALSGKAWNRERTQRFGVPVSLCLNLYIYVLYCPIVKDLKIKTMAGSRWALINFGSLLQKNHSYSHILVSKLTSAPQKYPP